MRRLLIILVLLWATPAAAGTLIIQLRTDYLPQVDFEFVQVDVYLSDVLVAETEFHAVEDDYVRGVRVSEIDLGAAAYRVLVSLIDDAGNLLAERPVRVLISDLVRPVTMVITRPQLGFTKTDTLETDVDGDGVLGAGDIVRYQVEIQGPTPGGRFTDTPSPGGSLVTGTVTSTRGTVQEGNDVDDRGVVVDVDELLSGETAAVTFDVEMTPVASNQARVTMKTTDTLNVLRSGGFHSSDTDVSPNPGPTLTPVATTAVTECREELFMVAAELEAIITDPDGDGTPAIGDACPDTSAGTIADIRGCSQAQFCAGIDVSTGTGRGTCNNADWLDDEPGSRDPQDCRARDGRCEVF